MPPKLNRRQAIGVFGAAGLGVVVPGCSSEEEPSGSNGGGQAEPLDSANSCRVTVEQTEGPYYFDADAMRRDIREDRKGAPLRLRLRVRDAETCKPIPDAVVDVWHSDAQGVYSGFESGEGERFLRGTQPTDERGVAEFVTIWPGWYQGRTPHIHAKVHLGRETALTTQLYFDDATAARVYRDRRYRRDEDQQVTNSTDGIFDDSLLMTLRQNGDGWVGEMNFDVERA